MKHLPTACRIALLSALALSTSGCWLFAASSAMNGQKIPAEFTGLNGKSVAIVVYADQASTDEFPNAREEIGNFLTAAFHAKIPSVRLLDPKEVIAWQDDTLNWTSLAEKDIGQHFKADKVLYIELLDYSTRANRNYGDLQGHIRANCKIFDSAAGTSPEWSALVDVYFPRDRPLDPTSGSEVAVRKRSLELFSNELVNHFVDHREVESTVRQQEE